MLGFFQKYQKTLMLVLLTPALIGMGITGAIMAVMTDQGDPVVGKVFGDEIHAKKFDEYKRLYLRTAPGADEEMVWRFLAMLKEAQEAGLKVSEAEVGKQIHTNMGFQIARTKAMEEIKKRKVDISSPEGRKLFQQIVLQTLLNKEKNKFNKADYEKALERMQGMSVRDYETQQVREALVQRYLETLRELAVLEPKDVWNAFQEKHHLRVLEMVAIPAESYLPNLAAKEGEPGYVSKEQIKRFYDARVRDYDEPRRVDIAYIALPFEDARLELERQGPPKDEVLKAFNEREGIAPVNSFKEHKEEIRKTWFKVQAKDRVAEVMDAIADAVQVARDEKKPADLKAIAAKVGKDMKCEALLHEVSGLVTKDDFEDDKKLPSSLHCFAGLRWFRYAKTGKTSDVLGGKEGWFVLQAKEVKAAKTPPYKDVEATVREDYVRGSKAELKAHYDEYKGLKYRKDNSWRVEAVVATDKAFGDHAKAKAAIKTAHEKGSAWSAKKTDFPFDRFETDPDVSSKLVVQKENDGLTKAELEEHDVFSAIATEVPTAKRYKLSAPFEVKTKGKEGWAFYRMVKQLPQKTKEFEAVKDDVRKQVRLARAVFRAEEGSKQHLSRLQVLDGDALQKAIQELGFKVITTEPFDRNAVSLKDIPDAGDLVAEAFSTQSVVGGPYFRAVPDVENSRVLILRVKEKQDAPDSKYAERYASIRADLLTKKRTDYAESQVREMTLRAKGITEEHLKYATEVRDGPGGIVKVKLRQIFVRPDPAIIDGWLEGEAMKIIEKAKAAIKSGTEWQVVVDQFSEDDRTRGNKGELAEAGRGDFLQDYGSEFENAVFTLPLGHISEPVKSKAGFHLVQLVKITQEKRKIFRHLLVKTDAKTRRLPKEVTEKAEKASQAKLEAALKGLEAGKAFGEMAEKYGDSKDPNGRGQQLEIGFVTHVERAALAQLLEWERAEDHPQHSNDNWLPEIVEVPGAGFHLFACSRDRSERRAAWEGKRRNREVYHIQGDTQASVNEAREELAEFIEDAVKDKDKGRPTWLSILDEFKKHARETSKAPSKAKGGALGLFRLEDTVRPYGEEFLKRACYIDATTPVKAGHRTAVFRGEIGYHLIQVVGVETVKPDDPKRRADVSVELLTGTDWK